MSPLWKYIIFQRRFEETQPPLTWAPRLLCRLKMSNSFLSRAAQPVTQAMKARWPQLPLPTGHASCSVKAVIEASKPVGVALCQCTSPEAGCRQLGQHTGPDLHGPRCHTSSGFGVLLSFVSHPRFPAPDAPQGGSRKTWLSSKRPQSGVFPEGPFWAWRDGCPAHGLPGLPHLSGRAGQPVGSHATAGYPASWSQAMKSP